MQLKKILQKTGLAFMFAACLAIPSPAFAENITPIEAQDVNYDSFDELEEFTQEAQDVVAEDDLESNSLYASKRLIVISNDPAFDAKNATDVLHFDNIYVLTYDSEKDCKKAYKSLQKNEAIQSVEIDAYLSVATESLLPKDTETDTESTETLLPETAAPETETEKPKEAPDGEKTIVAVLDTGYSGKEADVIDSGFDLSGSGTALSDENGHGTLMADIILKASEKNVKVKPYKVADENGKTSALGMYMAIKQAAADKADVINISMSAYKNSQAALVETAIKEAKGQGIFTVVSAGNSAMSTENFSPANVEEAITVSAANGEKDGITDTMPYTNYGSNVDFAAYGKVEIDGETPSGTSVSAAIVSAVLADEKSADQKASYDATYEKLKEKAIPNKDDIYSHFGNGLLTGTIDGLYDDDEYPANPLLGTNWKTMTDEQLDEAFLSCNDYQVRDFLDTLSETEKEAVLKKETCLTEKTIAFYGDDTKKPENADKYAYETRYDYLYSDEFSDYTINALMKNHGVSVAQQGTKTFEIQGLDTGIYQFQKSSEEGHVETPDDYKIDNAFALSCDNYSTIKVEASASNFKVTMTEKSKSGIEFPSDKISLSHAAAGSGNTAGKYFQVCVNKIKATKPAHSEFKAVLCDESCGGFSIPNATALKSDTCHRTYDYIAVACDMRGIDTRHLSCDASIARIKLVKNSQTVQSTCAVRGYKLETGHYQCKDKDCKKPTSGPGFGNNIYSIKTDYGFADHAFNGSFVDYDANNHIRYCDNYAACQSVNPGGYQLQAHSWPGWTLDYGPTCQRDGLKHQNCTVCNHHLDTVNLPKTGEHADIAKLDHNDGLPESPGTNLDALNATAVWNYETSNGIANGRRYTHCTNGCDRIVLNQYYVSVTKDNDSIKDVTNANNYYEVATPKTGVYAHQGGNWQDTWTVSLTANPLIGHHFVRFTSAWMGGNSANQTHTFSMPAGAVAIHAEGDINISTLVVNPNFVSNRYKKSCDAYWDGSSDVRSFGPKDWHSTKDIPVPTRVGYDFSGWDFSSDHPAEGPGVMSALTAAAVFTYGSDCAPVSTDTITAKWTPRNDTKYVIRHWQQNLGYIFDGQPNGYDTFEMEDYENYYTLADTENLQGTSDKTLQFKEIAKDYKGFHFVGGRTNDNDGPFVINSSTRILPDGKTEIDLFYARNRYQVDVPIEGYGDTTITGEVGKTGNPSGDWFLYGDNVTVTYEPNDGWCTKYIVVDGTKIEGEDFLPYLEEYKFPAIDAHHKVKVVFKRLPHLNITSLCGTDKDAVTAWTQTMAYEITGTDYLGRERSYFILTDEFDKPVDRRVLPGEYTVTPQPLKPWYTTDGSVDQFQKGSMTDAFAITVDVTDCPDVITERKAPTASFQYTFMPDWEQEGDSNIVANELKKK